jgi:hypothetical protein
LSSEGYGAQPAIYTQTTTATQSSAGSAARLHKQIEWKRIKAFLNDAAQEGIAPASLPSQAQSDEASLGGKMPTGWVQSQLTQLGRYEATVYGKVYTLQLHGPDTPDKRLHRLEQTLQVKALSLPALSTSGNNPTDTRLAALKARMEALGITASDGDQQKVSDWAIALMEARVFQGANPNQSTEQRVQALEVAVFGVPATDLTPVTFAPETLEVPVPAQKTSAQLSLAKRVSVLGEQFPIRLKGINGNTKARQPSLEIATLVETALPPIEFVAEPPSMAPLAKPSPSEHKPASLLIKTAITSPQVVPTQPTPEPPPVWFKTTAPANSSQKPAITATTMTTLCVLHQTKGFSVL